MFIQQLWITGTYFAVDYKPATNKGNKTTEEKRFMSDFLLTGVINDETDDNFVESQLYKKLECSLKLKILRDNRVPIGALFDFNPEQLKKIVLLLKSTFMNRLKIGFRKIGYELKRMLGAYGERYSRPFTIPVLPTTISGYCQTMARFILYCWKISQPISLYKAECKAADSDGDSLKSVSERDLSESGSENGLVSGIACRESISEPDGDSQRSNSDQSETSFDDDSSQCSSNDTVSIYDSDSDGEDINDSTTVSELLGIDLGDSTAILNSFLKERQNDNLQCTMLIEFMLLLLSRIYGLQNSNWICPFFSFIILDQLLIEKVLTQDKLTHTITQLKFFARSVFCIKIHDIQNDRSKEEVNLEIVRMSCFFDDAGAKKIINGSPVTSPTPMSRLVGLR